MGLVTLWKNYLPWTQAVVIAAHIARTKRLWLQLVWFLFLVGTWVAFFIQSYYLIKDYLSYQKTTNIRLFYQPETPFPAVTFCNLNPFKKSMVHHSQELSNLLSAYTYVTKVKQAQMESGTTPAPTTSTATTVGSAVEVHRAKRQAVPPNCAQVSSGTSASTPVGATKAQDYKVYNCTDGTAFIDFTSCDTWTVRTAMLPSATIIGNVDAIQSAYYGCFHHFCNDGGCSLYTDGLNVMAMEGNCLGTKDGVVFGIAAQAVATYCSFGDASCTMGAQPKPESVYSGACYYELCGVGLAMSCDDCAGGVQSFTHNMDPSCKDLTQYAKDMTAQVGPAMSDTQCGANCTAPPCQYKKSDPCSGRNYNVWLCALSTCNVSTTSWFTSTTTQIETTTMETTPEATTIELTSTRTTTEPTTTELTTSTTTTATTTTEPSTSTTELPTTTTTEQVTSTTSQLTTTTAQPSTTTTAEMTTMERTTAMPTTTEPSTTTVATTTDLTSTTPSTTSEPTTTTSAATTTTQPETSTSSTTLTTTTEPTTTQSPSTATATTSSSSRTSTSSSSTTTEETTTAQNTTTTTGQTTTTTSEATTTASSPAGTTSRGSTDATSTTSTGSSSARASQSITSNAKTTTSEIATSTSTVASTVTSSPKSSSTTSEMSTTSSTPTESTTSTVSSATTTKPSTSSSSTTSPTSGSSGTTSMTASSSTASGSSTTVTSEGSTGGSSTTTSVSTPSSTTMTGSTWPVTTLTSARAATATTTEAMTTTSSAKASTPTHSTKSSAGVASISTSVAGTRSTTAVTAASGYSKDGIGISSTLEASSATSRDITRSDEDSTSSTTAFDEVPVGATTSTAATDAKTVLSSSSDSDMTSSTVGSSSSGPNVSSTKRSADDGSASPRSTGPEDGGGNTSTSSAGKSSTTLRTSSSGGKTVSGSGNLTSAKSSTATPKSSSDSIAGGFTTVSGCSGCANESTTTSTARNPNASLSSTKPDAGAGNRSTTPSPLAGSTTMRNGPGAGSSNSTVIPTKPTASNNDPNGGQGNDTSTLPTSSKMPNPGRSDDQGSITAGSNNAGERSTKNSGSDDHNPYNNSSTTTDNGQNSDKASTKAPSQDPRLNASTSSALDSMLSTTPTTIVTGGQAGRTTEDGGGNGGKQHSSGQDGRFTTADPTGNGGGGRGKSRSTTPNPSNHTAGHGTGNGDDPANLRSTTHLPGSGGNGSELTTTSYEDYLKNIKLNLSANFNLTDLTTEQKRDLEALSNVYGLDPNNDKVVIDANMKQALQIVAAKMSPELRQILGFQLKDLVSSCIINGDPCDQANDFEQTFDVDYGNCYTFNFAQQPVKYIARQSGAIHGLHMTIIANSSEQLPSSIESGVKVVVHDQDLAPFPNVEGYKSPTGQIVSLIVTYSKLSRLGSPYGECSTLDSIAKNNQPFYFNGTYSTEGCFRSCFQQNIATACGCADSRFPAPTDMNVPFCDPLDPPRYKCMEAYIEDNGDYFFVNNCVCYDACQDATYKTQISEAVWPSGTFFYGGFCKSTKQINYSSCSEFYSENGMTLEVNFAQLGYESLEEEPTSTVWALVNNLAGNTGLWVGYTMLSFTECALIVIQVGLWICQCPKELPEVPSCRTRNFFAEEDEDSSSDESSVDGDDAATISNAASIGSYDGKTDESFDALGAANGKISVISLRRVPPKNFDNSIDEKVLNRKEVREAMPSSLELYDQKNHIEKIEPIAAHTSDYANHVAHE